MRVFMGRRWEDSLSLIAERLGRPLPPSFGDDYRARRDEAFERELEPVAGIADAIARIELERCVASSGTQERIRFVLGLTGLLELFEDRIFSAQEVEHGKPAPDLFLHAADRMARDPGRCAVVEDSRVGIEAGVAAGMTVFGFCWYLDPADRAGRGRPPVRVDGGAAGAARIGLADLAARDRRFDRLAPGREIVVVAPLELLQLAGVAGIESGLHISDRDPGRALAQGLTRDLDRRRDPARIEASVGAGELAGVGDDPGHLTVGARR